MTRPASARRSRTSPADVRLPLEPTAIETGQSEVERFVSERDADLRAERLLLLREACIVVAILVGLVFLQVLSV
jgi:hypothetical protein